MESYTGQDILKFNDRILTNLADGDVATITYPNELHGMKNGKNGNSIAAHNEQGNMAELVIRVLKGSPDDKYLNSFVLAWKNHLDTFSPATAEFTKVISVDNSITNEITSLGFIVPTRSVDTKDNVEGDTEQAVSIYNFRAGTSARALS
jgi:hypothetical protein